MIESVRPRQFTTTIDEPASGRGAATAAPARDAASAVIPAPTEVKQPRADEVELPGGE